MVGGVVAGAGAGLVAGGVVTGGWTGASDAGVAAATLDPDGGAPAADARNAGAEAPGVAAALVAAGSAVVGVTIPFGSGAGGAPEGGRVDVVATAAEEPAGTVAAIGEVVAVAGAPAKITATRPIVAAAAEIPVSARAVDAGW